MKLVIVESPAKSKTISHYLGEDYVVEASIGHVRDLAISGKGGLGVDCENNFEPKYIINKDKKEVVKKLTTLAKKSEEVILATDPDREGEAIAWHLAQVLKLDVNTAKRLEFHEITKNSIKNAIENPRLIDMNLVHSQEARRIIDRVLGFKLSSLMKSKLGSQSAGRVQSVTLKMIVEHEKEINDFVSEEYWTLNSKIKVAKKTYSIDLVKIDDKVAKIPNKESAEIVLSYADEDVSLSDKKTIEKSIPSKEAFRTSTLQQEAFNKYKFKTKETTMLAQQLYEGVEINGTLVGLITYIRTDSTKLSDSFIASARKYIIDKFGSEYYLGSKGTKEVKNAQDAHEAIRPTDLSITPEIAKQSLSDHQYKLYKLIYERALSSLMKNKIQEVTTLTFKNSHLTFELKGIKVVFPGYDVLKVDDKESSSIPNIEVSSPILYKLEDKKIEQHFTKPPSRYSEAKIVKLMEEKGIGRPSTYASTIQTLISRKYVSTTGGVLTPTEQGVLTSNVLTKYFPDLMNTEYTAEMETNLDKISDGSIDELKVINDFYVPFINHFEEVKEIMYKEPLKTTGEKCPVCGGDLVIRKGKHGEFVGCSNYPECTYIKKDESKAPKLVGRDCPNCGSPLVIRKNKSGDEFIGCSNFPKCKYIESLSEESHEDKICPKCGAKLVIRRSKRGRFYGCSNYPKCDYIESIKKTDKNETN